MVVGFQGVFFVFEHRDALGEGFVGNDDVLDMVFEGLFYAHGVLLDRFGENRTVSGAGGGLQSKIPLMGTVDFCSFALLPITDHQLLQLSLVHVPLHDRQHQAVDGEDLHRAGHCDVDQVQLIVALAWVGVGGQRVRVEVVVQANEIRA